MEKASVNDYDNNIIETASIALNAINIPGEKNGAAQDANNILLRSAEFLLLKIYNLRRLGKEAVTLQELQKTLISDIQKFDFTLKSLGAPAFLILVLRYVLCTVIDEAVLLSEWGRVNEWGRHSLLNVFHQDTRGGEQFFVLLEKMQQVPQGNIDVLEFMYVCLSLGFAGKYRLMENGQQELETLRQRLFTQIRGYRFFSLKVLLPNYDPPKKMHKFHLKWKAPLSITLGLVVISFIVLKAMLLYEARPTVVAFKTLSQKFTNMV